MDYSGLLQKISEGSWRFPKTVKDYEDKRRGPTIAEDVQGTLPAVNNIFFGNSKH